MEPKYFLLMAGDHYYPAGMEDWINTFSTYEEALKQVSNIIHERIITKGKRKGEKEITGTSYQINNRNYDWFEIEDLREWIYKE